MTESAIGRFDMGRVVQRTFGVLGRNFGTFFGLAVVLAGVPQALFYSGVTGFGVAAQSGTFNGGGFGLVAVGFVGMLIGGVLLQAGLIHATVADLNGKRVSIGDAVSTGGRFLLPLVGLGILMLLALMLGYALLLVPGLMLSVAWIAAAPALVVEKRGVFESFGRSADLTRGNRWAIFGLCVAYVVLGWIFGALVSGVITVAFLAAPPTIGVYGSAVGQAVASVFTTLVATAGAASIYYELRAAKEGVGAEALASVFD